MLEDRLDPQPRVLDALLRAPEQLAGVGRAPSQARCLLDMHDHQFGLEPQTEMDGLFQRFVGVGAPVQTYEQACEHGWWRRSGEHREGLQVAQPKHEQLAGHREPSRQYVVASARLEALGHYDIFGAAASQRYPPPLAHRPFERIERFGREGAVLRNRPGGWGGSWHF